MDRQLDTEMNRETESQTETKRQSLAPIPSPYGSPSLSQIPSAYGLPSLVDSFGLRFIYPSCRLFTSRVK